MKIQQVLDEELSSIQVGKDELQKLLDVARDVLDVLKKGGFTAHLGGSLAKGTVVTKDVQDIDIFVVLPSEKDTTLFSKSIEKLDFGKDFEMKVVHGSRDYVQLIGEKITIELIPTVLVKNPEDAENVTDVSLFHVDYVKSEIEKNPTVADDILLAKAFCSSQGCYGAEGYIRGFSGYALEVLVLHFGSFLDFLKKVGTKNVIDPAKHFAKEKDALYHINSAKLQGPLIVVDPTYKYRNVTAGLGKETYHKFLDVAQAFVKKPSRDFFVKQELDVTELKKIAEKKKATLFVLEIESNRQEGDIVGTKCLKFLDFFSEELQRQNQHVLHKEFVYSGKGHVAHGYVIVQENSEVVLKGPPTKMAEAATAFRKEHKRAYEKGGYLFATRKTNVQEIFTQSNRVKDEMGVFGKSITQL